jgi:hypothetical protein
MLASLYADLADETECGFFDAGSVAKTTPLDGVHLDAENTRAIGKRPGARRPHDAGSLKTPDDDQEGLIVIKED